MLNRHNCLPITILLSSLSIIGLILLSYVTEHFRVLSFAPVLIGAEVAEVCNMQMEQVRRHIVQPGLLQSAHTGKAA